MFNQRKKTDRASARAKLQMESSAIIDVTVSMVQSSEVEISIYLRLRRVFRVVCLLKVYFKENWMQLFTQLISENWKERLNQQTFSFADTDILTEFKINYVIC